VDEVRERRRRHGVGGGVRLLLSPEQQSRLENWMEFQNYHLKRLEGFEKKRDKLKKELDDARKKAEVFELAVEDAEAVRQELENAERDLERHKVLLQWIEQERQTMDRGHPTPTEEDNDDRDTAPKAVRRTSTRDRRTRRAEASTVLGKVRITKAKSKKRNTQIQKPKALELEPAIQDSDVTPQSSISQAPKVSRDEASTYQGRDATRPNSSAEGVQGKTIRWCQGEITVRDTTPWRRADPIFRPITI